MQIHILLRVGDLRQTPKIGKSAKKAASLSFATPSVNKSKLSLENRLLMALEYIREYRTYFHIEAMSLEKCNTKTQRNGVSRIINGIL